MDNSKNKKLKKYALDSSAAFYPYFTTKKTQSMFCVGAELDGEVDRELLRRAANDAICRFPLYKTRVKKGYGAYFLQENVGPVEVFELDGRVLAPIDTKKTGGYQFRLSCGGSRIRLEMFHALTDANGALEFLKVIIRRYRELEGVAISEACTVDAWDAPAGESELEDGFKKYYKPIPFSQLNLKGMAGGAPHRTQGTLIKGGYKLDGAAAQSDDLIRCAKAMGVSVTAYIAGVVGYGILKSADVKLPIAIMVPVNLRKIFPSDTTSNFVMFVRLIVRGQECKTLEDCVRTCAEQLSEKAAKDKMQAFISTTVRAQRNVIFRCVPLFLKWIFIRLGRLMMKSRQTIIVSNLGSVSVPEELGIKSLTLNLNVSKNNVQNLGAVSCGGECRLTFTSAIKELTLPTTVFDILEEQGVNIAKTDFIRSK